MSHSKTPYSPNFPASQGYAPPPQNTDHYPSAPYLHDPHTPAAPPPYPPAQSSPYSPSHTAPYPPAQISPYPPAQTSPYPPAQASAYPPPYPTQAGALDHGFQPEPGFKPSYQQTPPHQPFPVAHAPAFPQPQPVVQQPSSAPFPQQPPQTPSGWMTIPQGVPNCPRGLEYLSTVDTLLVKQKVDLLEAFVGFEKNNKYMIQNTLGQNVYYAVESNDCCTRNCLGSARPFDLKIYDIFNNEVVHLYRPLRCDTCCFPCCMQVLEVSSPPGNIIGTVEQSWSLFRPSFVVKNDAGQPVVCIKGPLMTCSMLCRSIKFNIYTPDGVTKIGKITKEWTGLAREFFTDSDFFGVKFPFTLDVKVKATLLGAVFLIDYMYYENNTQRVD